jgi:hypothetical protein
MNKSEIQTGNSINCPSLLQPSLSVHLFGYLLNSMNYVDKVHVRMINRCMNLLKAPHNPMQSCSVWPWDNWEMSGHSFTPNSSVSRFQRPHMTHLYGLSEKKKFSIASMQE